MLDTSHAGDWSSGMIPASGAGGREFDSRITPRFFFDAVRRVRKRIQHHSPLAWRHVVVTKSVFQSVLGLEPRISCSVPPGIPHTGKNLTKTAVAHDCFDPPQAVLFFQPDLL
jgi:hypothetical protein